MQEERREAARAEAERRQREKEEREAAAAAEKVRNLHAALSHDWNVGSHVATWHIVLTPRAGKAHLVNPD